MLPKDYTYVILERNLPDDVHTTQSSITLSDVVRNFRRKQILLVLNRMDLINSEEDSLPRKKIRYEPVDGSSHLNIIALPVRLTYFVHKANIHGCCTYGADVSQQL